MAIRSLKNGTFSRSLLVGNAYYNPAPTSPVSGYYMWFDASDTSTITSSGGFVSQWNDKSANALNVTNVAAANPNRPKTGVSTMNGKNVLTWDDATLLKGLVRDTPSPLTGNPNVTIFVVANYKTGANYYGASTLLGIGNDQASPDGSTIYAPGFIVTPAWGTVGSAFIGASPNRTVAVNQDLRNTARCYIINKNSSNVTTAYFGKTSQGTVSGSWNVYTTGSGFSKFAIGYSPQNGTTGNYTAFGDIAEILIYTSSLSTTDRELNVDYLANKWGL
jgi:hypothetical protein